MWSGASIPGLEKACFEEMEAKNNAHRKNVVVCGINTRAYLPFIYIYNLPDVGQRSIATLPLQLYLRVRSRARAKHWTHNSCPPWRMGSNNERWKPILHRAAYQARQLREHDPNERITPIGKARSDHRKDRRRRSKQETNPP